MKVRVVAANDRPTGAEGVVAFGWNVGGAVLVFEDTLTEIDAHIAAGGLTASWWTRLLEHERDFHLTGDRNTGLWHNLHAARLAARLLWAWALVRGAWKTGAVTSGCPG